LVVDVTKAGPADGLVREGDIILAFNGKTIEKMKDVPRLVAETAVGQKVRVLLLREGKEVGVDVTLGRLETGPQQTAAATSEPSTPGPDVDEPVGPPPGLKDMLGIDLGPIDDAARGTYDLGTGIGGIVITEVTKGSDAEKQGLVAGLVVSEVNQQKVETVADVTEKVNAAKEAGRPAVLLKVTDGAGNSRFVAVRLN
jgi:serine protease Do